MFSNEAFESHQETLQSSTVSWLKWVSSRWASCGHRLSDPSLPCTCSAWAPVTRSTIAPPWGATGITSGAKLGAVASEIHSTALIFQKSSSSLEYAVPCTTASPAAVTFESPLFYFQILTVQMSHCSSFCGLLSRVISWTFSKYKLNMSQRTILQLHPILNQAENPAV